MSQSKGFAIGFLGAVGMSPIVHELYGPLAFTLGAIVLVLWWFASLLSKLRSGTDGSFIMFDEFKAVTFDEPRRYDWAACRSPTHLGLGCSDRFSERATR
jgi:hypothetical protein